MKTEEKNEPVVQTANAGGNVENVEGKQDVVDYNSFKKAVDEKKLFQTRLTDTEKELQSLRDAEMKRKGKYDELLSEREKRIVELETKLDQTGKNYAWSTLTGEIERVAEKAGCKNTKKLIKLMGDDDLQELSKHIDENFKINPEALKTVVEKSKKENFFLFSDDASKVVVNGNPRTKVSESKEIDYTKLTLDELKALHKKSYN